MLILQLRGGVTPFARGSLNPRGSRQDLSAGPSPLQSSGCPHAPAGPRSPSTILFAPQGLIPTVSTEGMFKLSSDDRVGVLLAGKEGVKAEGAS